MKSSSRSTLAHILPIPSSKVLRPCQAFNSSSQSANRALATVLCAFCWQLSQIEARNRGNRDLSLATPGATLSDRLQGFTPESAITCEFTRFRTVTLPMMM